METMLMSACEASLKPLDIDCIDFYYQYHIETRVPIEVKVRQFSFVFINLAILSFEYWNHCHYGYQTNRNSYQLDLLNENSAKESLDYTTSYSVIKTKGVQRSEEKILNAFFCPFFCF